MAKKFENSINVFAPATVANLACGFDVMGLAIDSPGDEVHVEFNRNGRDNFSVLLIENIKSMSVRPS